MLIYYLLYQHTVKIYLHIAYHWLWWGSNPRLCHVFHILTSILLKLKSEQSFVKARIRTWNHRLKVQSANHYTMGDFVSDGKESRNCSIKKSWLFTQSHREPWLTFYNFSKLGFYDVNWDIIQKHGRIHNLFWPSFDFTKLQKHF